MKTVVTLPAVDTSEVKEALAPKPVKLNRAQRRLAHKRRRPERKAAVRATNEARIKEKLAKLGGASV